MGDELEFEPDYTKTDELNKLYEIIWNANRKINCLLEQMPRFSCQCKCEEHDLINHIAYDEIEEKSISVCSCAKCGGYIDN